MEKMVTPMKTKMPFRTLSCLLLAVAVVAIGIAIPAGSAHGFAVIDNGTIMLGVNDEGHLNTPFGSGPPSSGSGTTSVGLRFIPTGAEATSPGCLCEGWGAAVASLGVSGYANVSSDGGAVNLSLVSFTSTASTAVSVVTISGLTDIGVVPVLKVTHDYHPSVSANLYQVDVTIENISGADLGLGATDLRYRRVMDWDIEPTFFDEFVTIGGLPAANVIATSDNGFATANPLGGGHSDISGTGCAPLSSNFTDCGPDDHGANFDFGFPALAAGESRSFKVYYGASSTELEAFAALAAVGAEVYSLGQCNPGGDASCSPITGLPNTFIFAFGDVGGVVVPNPVPEPGTMLLLGSGLAGLAAWRRKKAA
jgi:hypothetical protein